jgi:hypothetical protein
MDGHRRRKTVIAGTFAIARKSLSNAQPISVDETQRTAIDKRDLCARSLTNLTLSEAAACPRRRARGQGVPSESERACRGEG